MAKQKVPPMTAEEMRKHNEQVVQVVKEIHRLMATSKLLHDLPPASVLEGLGAYFVTVAQHYGIDRRGAILILDHAAATFLAVIGDESDPAVKFAAAMERGDAAAATKVLADLLNAALGGEPDKERDERLKRAAAATDAKVDAILKSLEQEKGD